MINVKDSSALFIKRIDGIIKKPDDNICTSQQIVASKRFSIVRFTFRSRFRRRMPIPLKSLGHREMALGESLS